MSYDWTEPFTWKVGDPLTAFKLNALMENLNFLKNKPQAYAHGGIAANISLTSTSLIAIDTTLFEQTLVTTGRPVLFGVHIPYHSHSAASGVSVFDVLIDDTTYLSSLGATSKTYGFVYHLNTDATDAFELNWVFYIPASILDAGEHKITLVGKVTSGTLTIAVATADWAAQSWAKEI